MGLPGCVLPPPDLFPNAGIGLIQRQPGTQDTWCFRITRHSRCFDGHFEGAAIFPGVAHIALVLQACALRDGRAAFLTEVKDLRLRRPVYPGDEIAVVVDGPPNSDLVRFELRRADETVSAGVIAIRAEAVNA